MRYGDGGNDMVSLGRKQVIAETDKAIGLYDGKGSGPFWVPRSVCDKEGREAVRGQTIDVEVQKWWAQKEGLE